MRKNSIMDVSIIIPVYNGEKTIKRAVISAINQNNKKVQVIVVNDGSSDSTEQICQELSEKYTNILILKQRNQGVSSARNLGLQYSIGKYIAFLDADDVLKSDFCDEMVAMGEKNNSDMIICGYDIIAANIVDQWIPENKTDEKKILSELINTGGMNMLWNKLFLREKIQKNFNVTKNMGEDLEFISEYLKNVQTISVVHKSLYCYYKDNSNSLTHTICTSPEILLYEYASLIQIANTYKLCINLRDRLVFRTCDQFLGLEYKRFKLVWIKFRKMNDFDKLIHTYNAKSEIYKIISFFISTNNPVPVFCLLKIKYLKTKMKFKYNNIGD